MKKGTYKHYKGKYYEVVGLAKESETLEDYVVYKPLYEMTEFGEIDYWVRPLDNFNSKVDFKGKIISRFEYIGDAKYEEMN